MAIQFLCPSCKTLAVVPDDFAGKNGKCKRCKAMLTVPHATEEAGSATHQATDCEIAEWLGLSNQKPNSPSPSKQPIVPSIPRQVAIKATMPVDKSNRHDKTQLTLLEAKVGCFIAVVVFFVGCFLIGWSVRWFRVDRLLTASRQYRSRYEADFVGHFNTYKAAMEVAADSTNSSSPRNGQPYQVVAIQQLRQVVFTETADSKTVIPNSHFPTRDPELALCQTLMPDDLSAESPQTANVAVWIEYWPLYETHKTTYTQGLKRTYTNDAYTTQVNVVWRIVDLKQKRLLKSGTINYSTRFPAGNSWDDYANISIQRQIAASIVETLSH